MNLVFIIYIIISAKKLKEQERKLQEAEEKKKRMQMNAEALQDWMKNSVHKPKPVPLNRGLDSTIHFNLLQTLFVYIRCVYRFEIVRISFLHKSRTLDTEYRRTNEK